MNDRLGPRRPAPVYTAYIALGSNMGDRIEHLRFAVTSLAKIPRSQVLRTSRVWSTAPMGPAAFPFLNAALAIKTIAAPLPLLDVLLQLERARGRVRRERWGPRTLDLDLIAMLDPAGEMVVLDTPRLVLPHPEATRRDFVLRPMLEVAPSLRLDGRRLDELLARLDPDAATLEGPTDLALREPPRD